MSEYLEVLERLEYLRGELRGEHISQGELIELQGLAEHIDPSDVELLEAAGVPEGVRVLRTEESHTFPVREGYKDHWSIKNVLNVKDDRGQYVRVGLGYIGPEGESRRTHGGPIVPGPYLYTYPLSVVIDNHGGTGAEAARLKAAGLEFYLQDGEHVIVRGVEFTFRDGTNFRHRGAHYGEFVVRTD